MKQKRALTLRREILAELATAELRDVVGAAQALPTTPVDACPQLQNTNLYCYTRGTTCHACD